MVRHCEFCGNVIDNTYVKFGQTYFYYCPHCKNDVCSLETLRRYAPNLKPMNEIRKEKRKKCE